MKNKNIFLGLGTNLGNRYENLNFAQNLITQKIGKIVQSSPIYETEAWGDVEQNHFLNQVIEIESNFSALVVLQKILTIEQQMGRIRKKKWGERIIDIDIIYFNTEIINVENLKIPHPYIAQRKFVLIPLCNIAPMFIHPIEQLTNSVLLKKCTDNSEVKLWQA